MKLTQKHIWTAVAIVGLTSTLTFQNCGPTKKSATSASITPPTVTETEVPEVVPPPIAAPAIKYFISLATVFEETAGDCADSGSRKCQWASHLYCKKQGYVGGYSLYNFTLPAGVIQVACFPQELAFYAEYSAAPAPEFPNQNCLASPFDLWCSYFLDRKCAADPLAGSPQGVSVGLIGYNSNTNVAATLCLKPSKIGEKLKAKLSANLNTSPEFSTCANADAIGGTCVPQAADFCKAAGMSFPLPISQYNAANGTVEVSCLKE